jgi:hypothetical protein
MLIVYFTTGVIQFPSEVIIQLGISMSTAIFALFGLAYSTIMAGSLVKRDVVIPIVASIKESAAAKASISASASETNWLSTKITPTYKYGRSPLTVLFNIYSTQPQPDHPGVVSVDIDWSDGGKQLVPVIKGEASVSHTFTFVKNDKYTGHTFYPVFTVNGNDGSQMVMNVDGKSVEIWVESL